MRATVLIGMGDPVVTLNHAIIGTTDEAEALDWAGGLIRRDKPGFHAWVRP